MKFRYSTESLVEEQPIAAAAQEPRDEHKQRRSKPNRPKKPRHEDQPEKTEKAEKPPRPPKKPRPERKDAAPKAEAELPQPEQLNADAAPTKEKIHRRKPYYHNRRRKPKPDGGHAAE